MRKMIHSHGTGLVTRSYWLSKHCRFQRGVCGLLCAALLLVAAAAPAAGQDDPPLDWQTALERTWEGYKQHFIFCGADCGNNLGLVFDPLIGYNAVSEGVGYGMLMAVVMNDQAAFDVIFNAANTYLWDQIAGLYHWRADNSGTITGRGSATDADEDIALALIFAHQRVLNGEWSPSATVAYDERANTIIDAIFAREIYRGQYIIPGNEWYVDGQAITNPSYFTPAWYRIYDAFQGTDRWSAVIDQGYETIFATEGAPRGLTPDWSQADGAPAYPWCESGGSTLQSCRYEMYYDAIRVPWRIGTDCLWFGEPRACEWVNRGADFLLNETGRGNPDVAARMARMYDMAGNPIVSHQDGTMIGMWLAGAVASDNDVLAGGLSRHMLHNYSTFVLSDGFWGTSWEDQDKYYVQSLAWLGAAVAGGIFENLYPIN